MISLREITEENFYQVINLETTEEQKARKFVSSNAKSLAECWLYRKNEDVFPYAIYNDDKIVGFALIDIDFEENEFKIWRMMIDKEFQGRGFGTEAVFEIINMAKRGNYKNIVANYVIGNEAMKKILEKSGFENRGIDKDIDNEYKMEIILGNI